MLTHLQDFFRWIIKRVVKTNAATHNIEPKRANKIMNRKVSSSDKIVSWVVFVVVEFGVGNMLCDTAAAGNVVEIF